MLAQTSLLETQPQTLDLTALAATPEATSLFLVSSILPKDSATAKTSALEAKLAHAVSPKSSKLSNFNLSAVPTPLLSHASALMPASPTATTPD